MEGMRLHQWSKNILLFLAPLLSLKFSTFDWIIELFIRFIAFALKASSNYLINDLLDIQADRLHPKKRMRLFASGSL